MDDTVKRNHFNRWTSDKWTETWLQNTRIMRLDITKYKKWQNTVFHHLRVDPSHSVPLWKKANSLLNHSEHTTTDSVRTTVDGLGRIWRNQVSRPPFQCLSYTISTMTLFAVDHHQLMLLLQENRQYYNPMTNSITWGINDSATSL